ncbi:MAG TPA: DedA family protein [Draconibacterium sp.]|nr:DedA family protein [Draconibacterium sp.]
MEELFTQLVDWYMANMNYWTITMLMAIESSFIPFPSEIIIPPAAYKAANGELNVYFVVLFGTFGALLGALFNYYLAKFLGQKLLLKFADTRFARMMLMDRAAVEKAETYFKKNGNISTLIGRLVPGIRQLISIPAGLVSMNLKNFMLYTIIGSGIWNIILALLGYFFYSQKERLEMYYHEISYVMLGLGALYFGYLIYNGFKKNKNQPA